MPPTSAVLRRPLAFLKSIFRSDRTFIQPFVRTLTNNAASDWMTTLHPLRMQYEAFSNANPLMASVASTADRTRKERRPVAEDNAFLAVQEKASEQIVAALDKLQEITELWAEQIFMSVYWLTPSQAACGRRPRRHQAQRKLAEKSAAPGVR